MLRFINKQSRPASQPVIHDLVGCCGKLPLHGDFIRHNLKIREAVTLDDWVQDGVTLLNRRYDQKWKRVFQLSPNFRFAFVGVENDKTITGVIAPSRDKIGRDYPFVLFRASDNLTLKNHQALVPLVFAETYRTVDTLLRQSWQDTSLESVLKQIDAEESLHAELAEQDRHAQLQSILENTTIGEIWDDILPGADTNIRVAFMYVVMSSLQTVARRSPQRVHWGLRIPLPSGESANKHLAFWLQLSDAVLKGRNWRASLIWNPPVPGIPARLLLFFHQIPASYFALLIDPRRSDDTVLDVLEEIEELNADPLQISKYHFPSDMSLQEVMDEVTNSLVMP
jgi:type VI secretion system protein ImpM